MPQIVIICILALVFIGCGSVKNIPVNQPYEVYIPVTCDLPMPPKLVKVNNTMENIANIISYASQLHERTLLCDKEGVNAVK